MYESPLEVVITEMSTEIGKEIDNRVRTALSKVDIKVNEEELVKALAYDRNQYEKGYRDGIKVFEEQMRYFVEEKVGNLNENQKGC